MTLRHAPLASFICGWFNFLGNVAGRAEKRGDTSGWSVDFLGDAAFAMGFVSILNSALIISSKEPLDIYFQVGLAISITFLWAVQNVLRIDQQGWVYTVAAIFQIVATMTIVIVLFVMTPERATANTVFFSTYNGTGFPFPYVCLIGILSTLFSFAGYEGNKALEIVEQSNEERLF